MSEDAYRRTRNTAGIVWMLVSNGAQRAQLGFMLVPRHDLMTYMTRRFAHHEGVHWYVGSIKGSM